MNHSTENLADTHAEFNVKTFKGIATLIAIVILAIAALSAFAMASDVFFLVFLGILFAVFLVKISGGLKAHTSLPNGICLGVIVLLLVSISISTLGLFGSRVMRQINEFETSFTNSMTQVRNRFEGNEHFMDVAINFPFLGPILEKDGESKRLDPKNSKSTSIESESPQISMEVVEKGGSIFKRLFVTTLGVLTNLAVVFFIGVFVAIDPKLYKRGVVLMMPLTHRERVSGVMDELGEVLWKWLTGRAISILIIGIGTTIALWLLGVPLPVTLGILTGLLTFVPNVGGLFAFVFAVAFALSVGTTTAIWVGGVYLGLQFVESNIITPLIQQKQVSVPPAFMIASQLLMGVMFGIIGILVATPLLAVTTVCVKRFYVEDVLEKVKLAKISG